MKDAKEMQSIITIIQSCIIIVIKQSALGKGTYAHELICDFNSSLIPQQSFCCYQIQIWMQEVKLSGQYSFIANPKMSLLQRAVSKLQLCTVQSHLVHACQFTTYPGEQQLQLLSSRTLCLSTTSYPQCRCCSREQCTGRVPKLNK